MGDTLVPADLGNSLDMVLSGDTCLSKGTCVSINKPGRVGGVCAKLGRLRQLWDIGGSREGLPRHQALRFF